MAAEWVSLKELKTNEKNPRKIKDKGLLDLQKSLLRFSKMMAIRGIVVDSNGIVIGGNMRLLAIQKIISKKKDDVLKCLRSKEDIDLWERIIDSRSIPGEWVIKASDLSEEERERFILTDNVGFGEWDIPAMLEGWDEDLLKELIPSLHSAFFDIEDNSSANGDAAKVKPVSNVATVLVEVEKDKLGDFIDDLRPLVKKYGASFYAE